MLLIVYRRTSSTRTAYRIIVHFCVCLCVCQPCVRFLFPYFVSFFFLLSSLRVFISRLFFILFFSDGIEMHLWWNTTKFMTCKYMCVGSAKSQYRSLINNYHNRNISKSEEYTSIKLVSSRFISIRYRNVRQFVVGISTKVVCLCHIEFISSFEHR